jgi:UDP-N-acetylmuramoyl-tripeptide--D-alanyl-D-alanine ligase
VIDSSAETASRCGLPLIQVSDVQLALEQLARWNRDQFRGTVIGVTGSVGKTTTRRMLAAVLAAHGPTVQSHGNFNNELGVPLSLLRLSGEHQYAVLELAACRVGDIRRLAELARPHVGVVTRVAGAHLESFGSLDAIRWTKQELIESLPAHGLAVLNADDPCVLAMRDATSARATTAGESSFASFPATRVLHADYRGEVDCPVGRIAWQGGRHLLTSTLLAAAVGCDLGVPADRIRAALAAVEPDAGRGRIVARRPWTVIDETYNASPASMQAALRSLLSFKSASRRVVVLGDMAELGPEAITCHRELLDSPEIAQSELIMLCGPLWQNVAASGIVPSPLRGRLLLCETIDDAKEHLLARLLPGDIVLVKGSRSARMERVVGHLLDAAG